MHKAELYYFWHVMKDSIHQHRPLLFSLAYNILGEVQEAEDIVQDVFETWFSKQPDVQYPKAYLSRAVVNRSIDRLEALKKARETYKGPWLPVPVVTEINSVDEKAVADPLPYALLSTLEKLNPVERAAFILRQAFDFPYSEIADMCNVAEENARQLVHRAQEKLQQPRVRYEASSEENERLLKAFLEACASLDASALKGILREDVVLYTDGGGKVNAAVIPVHGPEKMITFLMNVLKGANERFDGRPVIVNGEPGAILTDKVTGQVDTICTIDTEGGKIVGVYFVRNPDKIVV